MASVTPIRVVESFSAGKRRDPALNEDGIFVGNRFAAVVDGVTSKSITGVWHPSPGVVARRVLLQAMQDADAAPVPCSMRQLQRRLDTRLRRRYGSRAAYYAVHPTERLQANVVVFSASAREIWLFGDCQAMVNGRAAPTLKRVDALLGQVRSFVWQAMSARGISSGPHKPAVASHRLAASSGASAPADLVGASDPSREAILPLLRLEANLANTRGEYGYFVFDGFTDPAYPIRRIAVHDGDEVVLASDGYPLLRPTLAASERELERLRAEDPHLVGRFPSTKGFEPGLASFDDRSYLRFVA